MSHITVEVHITTFVYIGGKMWSFRHETILKLNYCLCLLYNVPVELRAIITQYGYWRNQDPRMMSDAEIKDQSKTCLLSFDSPMFRYPITKVDLVLTFGHQDVEHVWSRLQVYGSGKRVFRFDDGRRLQGFLSLGKGRPFQACFQFCKHTAKMYICMLNMYFNVFTFRQVFELADSLFAEIDMELDCFEVIDGVPAEGFLLDEGYRFCLHLGFDGTV